MKGWLIAALAAVALGGVAVVVMAGDDDSAAEEESDDSSRGRRRGKAGRSEGGGRPGMAGGGGPQGGMDARVRTLEDQVARLQKQVTQLQGRRAFAGLASASSDALDEEAAVGDVESPEFESTVLDIVNEERSRERARRFEAFTEAALNELTEQASLHAEQREAVAGLWETERERLLPLIQEARSGERDFDEVRTEARTIREETDAEAAKVLDEEQYELYDELRPRGPGGRRGRGGGGPGGGGPGGGGPGGGGPPR